MLSTQMGNRSLLPFQFNILPLWERAEYWTTWLSLWGRAVESSTAMFCFLLNIFAHPSLMYYLKEWVILGNWKHVGYLCLPLRSSSPPPSPRDVFNGLLPCSLYPSRFQPVGNIDKRPEEGQTSPYFPPCWTLIWW